MEKERPFVDIKRILVEHLRTHVGTIVFTKANGESRTMRCTLALSIIPPELMPKKQQLGEGINHDLTQRIIRVFDLDIQQWRSINCETVSQFTFGE